MRYRASVFILVCLTPHIAGALDISGDFIVNSGDTIDVDLDVVDSVTIENHGIINGNILVNSGYVVRFKNYGDINGNFIRSVPGETIQYVTSAENIRHISNISDYVINVNSENPSDILNMFDIMNISDGATKIVLKDTLLLIDRVIPDSGVPIEIQGNSVTFYIDGSMGCFSGAVLSNVSGADPVVDIINVDDMYDVSSHWVSDKLYVSIVRQTNYSLAIGDKLGDYIDSLRVKNPDDKLVNALDAAQNRADMKRILSRSVRTNPIRIMDFSKSLSKMDTLFDARFLGVSVRPWYVSSDDFSVMGGDINLSGTIFENMVGTFGLFGGRVNYSGEYDDYSGLIYGGKIGALYQDDDLYLNINTKISIAKFRDIDVFDGDSVVHNPSGVDANVVADAGFVFNAWDSISLIPFVGARFDYVKVLGDTESGVDLRLGFNGNIETNIDGNKYSVGLRTFVETDGALYGGIYTDMLSTADGIGGGVDFGMLYDDMGISYKISANVRFVF